MTQSSSFVSLPPDKAHLLPPPRPAATLILVRERPDGPPELLMLERAATMKFAAGALVFPGGAVDPGDTQMAEIVAESGGLPVDEAAARIAAIRETLEESGIAVGLVPVPDPAAVTRLRAGIEAGEDFGRLLVSEGLALDLSALVPFARWCPPNPDPRRRYDTRFYVAKVSEGQEASVDRCENVSLTWGAADDILASDRLIVFPTRRNLERIALSADFTALCAYAARFPAETVNPWIEDRNGEPHLCIPDHLGYPVTAQPMSEVRRG